VATRSEIPRHWAVERRMPSPTRTGSWTAILLAGERPGGDPLAARFKVRSKALIRVAGISMLRRVAGTLLSVPEIGRVVILAQEPEALMIGDAAGLEEHPRVLLARSGAGIASSITAVAGSDLAPWPVLVTTADHALLTPAMVKEFLSAATGHDIAVGVGERRIVERRYPETRRTWLKFADGHYSGANLFALRGEGVASALTLWSRVEQDRKKVWKLITRFGPWLFIRVLTRTIGFQTAMEHAGARFGIKVRPVVMSAPEAAIDVDKMEDFELAEAILAGSSAVRRSLPSATVRA